MIGKKITATEGSVALGGNNSGAIANVGDISGAMVTLGGNNDGTILTVGSHAKVNFTIQSDVAQKLPSYLGSVIAVLAAETGFASGVSTARELPPEVKDKLKYNNLLERHSIIRDWTRHNLALERAYHGVEQQNPDARYLVRLRAGAIYNDELLKYSEGAQMQGAQIVEFARSNATTLVNLVIDRLLQEYCQSKTSEVQMEIARLAISLVVADAVIECEVLEKPDNAVAT